MTKSRKFQELNLSSSFLFGAFMGDKENCREVLEVLLERPVSAIHSVHAEDMLLFHPESHGIRLDVYAGDAEGTQYDVEMQAIDEHNLPLRSRYYQGKMDLMSLKPGEKYDDLKPLYIIFICAFDPFGEGLYRYTFQTVCLETKQPLGDGVQKIFFNCYGKKQDETSHTLRHFLKYVVKSDEETVLDTQDAFVAHIHAQISALKHDHQMEERYMIFEEIIEKAEKEGRNEGIKAGEQRILQLIRKMTENGQANEISRLYTDPAFLDEMLVKYDFQSPLCPDEDAAFQK